MAKLKKASKRAAKPPVAQSSPPPDTAGQALPPLTWYEAVDLICPHIVKLSAPQGQGTGFLISIGNDRCAIATASHVIDEAHYWEQPIRIDHPFSGKTLLVRHNQRAVFLDPARDTAAILFEKGDVPFPAQNLPLVPIAKFLKVGNEIGWLGFPAMARDKLCFFGGKISAWTEEEKTYLVDGVAINGVSGGPAFCILGDRVVLVGVVSAYMPNTATGEALPGLSVVRDVSQFHELSPTFASIEQAKQEQSPPTPPSPPPSPPADPPKPAPTSTP